MNKTIAIVASVIGIIVVGIAVAIWFMWDPKDDVSMDRVAIETPDEKWVPEMLYRLHFEEGVEGVGYAPNGDMIAIGQYLKVDIHDASNGEFIRSFEYDHSVNDVEFSPDSTMLGGGQANGGVVLYDVSGETEKRQLHGGFEGKLSFSPDGETVATSSRDGVVWIWNIEDGEQIAVLGAEDFGYTTVLEFSSDGKYLASGHFDGSVYYWDIASGEPVHVFDFDSIVGDITISPDGNILAVSLSSRQVYLFDLTNGMPVRTLESDWSVTKVEFSPKGDMLVAGANVSGNNMAVVWETNNWSVSHMLQYPIEGTERVVIIGLAFSPDGRKVLLSDGDGFVWMWQIVSPSEL